MIRVYVIFQPICDVLRLVTNRLETGTNIRHNKHKTEKYKRSIKISTALERSVK